ncbi:hypothetical protein [Streptomyces sp. NPDC093149]
MSSREPEFGSGPERVLDGTEPLVEARARARGREGAEPLPDVKSG